MTKSRLLGAVGLLVMGGVLAAVALVTMTARSHQTGSHAAAPGVAASVGAAAANDQPGQAASTTTAAQGTSPPVQRVITAGPMAPVQAPVQVPAGQAGAGTTVVPDPHGPPSIKPIASIAPMFADSIDGTSAGIAPPNRPPAGSPGAGVCSQQKNCR